MKTIRERRRLRSRLFCLVAAVAMASCAKPPARDGPGAVGDEEGGVDEAPVQGDVEDGAGARGPSQGPLPAPLRGRIEFEDIEMDGEVPDEQALREAVEKELSLAGICWARTGASATGKMSFVLRIDGDGRVTRVDVLENDTGSDVLEECYLQRLRLTRFGEDLLADEIDVEVGLLFVGD